MHDDTQATDADVPAQADTTEQQPSEANEQQQQVTPEATQGTEETQEVSTAEVKAEDTVEETLLAGKYKSPEDLERAYKELESKFGKETSEKAELSRILNETFLAPEVTLEATTDTDEYGGYDEPNPVIQEVEELKRKSAVQTFILSHSDADPQSMQQVLTTDPLVQQITGHEAKLEYAYLKSQGMTQQKAIADAEKKGAERTQVKMAEKTVAQVESAKKSAPVNDKADLIERMRYGDKTARAEVIGNLPAVQEMRRMAGLE